MAVPASTPTTKHCGTQGRNRYEHWTPLFLALPISWRGTLAQYAGRLHRLDEGKTEVLIYDYADLDVPVLARMHERRLRGYRAMGYEVD
jgi:superfamily II DNA or RNA helicase